MKVVIGNKAHQMSRANYEKLLTVASEQIPFGVYAVEKAGYAELRKDKCNSMSQLKSLTRQFKQQGFKVLSNNGR